MASPGNPVVGYPVVVSASGLIAGGVDMARTYLATAGSTAQSTIAETTANAGTILGFLCNSTTSGTVVLAFATAAGGAGTAFTGTITPTAGTWYPLPVSSPTGIYATIANTLSLTFVVVQ